MALIDFFLGRHSNEDRPQKTLRDVVLFNTKSGKKEHFTPLTKGIVKMYNCGPTVYAEAHIGNLRSYVFADTLRRTLAGAGYAVDQVINITDVGHLTSDSDSGADKIEEGARQAGLSAQTIAAKYTTKFLDDISALNVETNDVSFPRATEHIKEQIALIKTLEEKGYTYKIDDGIYLDSSLFKNYGALGGIDISGLKEGARVSINEQKKHPTDFALWKFSPKDSKRQQEWSSPWGTGFPGWHIECSAMSMKYLGGTLDIHTGGVDHIPVHHNNEIAQSEAATGKTFARFWLHNEHLMIEGRKISKSLGNTITINQIREKGIPPLTYRYFLLTGHYRTKMNFTWDALLGNAVSLFKLRKFFVEKLGNVKEKEPERSFLDKFIERMNDDLDTPRAISILWDVVRSDTILPGAKRSTLLAMDEWLGLGLLESSDILQEMQTYKEDDPSLPDNIKELLQKRREARDRKDWEESDKPRDEIKKSGFSVTDNSDGTILERIKKGN